MMHRIAISTQNPNRWIPIAMLFLSSLMLRVFQLGTQSLWLDEGSTWETIQRGWGYLTLELANPVSAYPLYHLFLKLWMTVAGDNEWALRLPSAIAGTGAVMAILATAMELQDYPKPDSAYPIAASLLIFASPFAIWYAQEAKVYSLFLLMAILLVWSFARAVRKGDRSAWILYFSLAAVSIFVHRLAILAIIGSLCALWNISRHDPSVTKAIPLPPLLRSTPLRFFSALRRRPTITMFLIAVVLSIAMLIGMAVWLGDEGASTGAHIPAGPLLALWLTFVRFSVDRGPGEITWWWLVPWGALTVWGIGSLFVPHRQGFGTPHRRTILLCFLLVPLMLFLAQLSFTRFYETRYLMVIYPIWLLILANPILIMRRWSWIFVYWGLFAATLVVSGLVLTQPEKGLFSQAPVKEQYKEAMEVVAERLHPDDLVILHPPYLEPLYHYYMCRLTSDIPPKPITFGPFKQGQTSFSQKDWDALRRDTFAGHLRSFLIISPDHARTVDKPHSDDEYGLVGLYYAYSFEQKKWPCGIWRFNGVHVFCQESPESYETGEVPHPVVEKTAQFGDSLEFLGYTLKATTREGVGIYRAGGVIPITLFWEVEEPIEEGYHTFLHLCQNCNQPPIASNDSAPLEGYLPTNVWLPGKPARDDRAIPLPRDLPPGEYHLLLGVYHPDEPAPEARLPISGAPTIGSNRLFIATVEVREP